MNTLCIVGNGFDLFHGVRSGYDNFAAYLLKVDEDKYGDLCDDFDFGPDDWANFEDQLSKLNPTRVFEDNQEFMVGYGSDDWSESYNHDFQDGVDVSVGEMYSFIYSNFRNWILGLQVPSSRRLKLPANSHYLTFNYTGTLQKTYCINPANVLHIHGKAGDKELVLGHSCDDHNLDVSYEEETDFRVVEAMQKVVEHIRASRKKVGTAIKNNEAFFAKLTTLSKIYVLGHSMSSVDFPYFEKIASTIKMDRVEWHVTYYNEVEKEKYLGNLKKLGVLEKNMFLNKMENIFN